MVYGPRQFIHVDTRGLKKLAEDLGTFRAKAVPHAARNALNAIAFEARGEWLDQMRGKLTLRNRYTERSALVDKATGTTLSTMQSVVGSKLGYLAEQEAGFTSHAKGKHGLPIPTPFAAGQALGTPHRTRTVQRPNLLSAIHLDSSTIKNRTGGVQGRRQRNAVAIKMAAKGGGRFVFLDLAKRKGLFKVTGTKTFRPRLVWDLSRKSTVTPAHMTMEPAVAGVTPRIPGFYATAIVAEMRRARILNYASKAQFGY